MICGHNSALLDNENKCLGQYIPFAVIECNCVVQRHSVPYARYSCFLEYMGDVPDLYSTCRAHCFWAHYTACPRVISPCTADTLFFLRLGSLLLSGKPLIPLECTNRLYKTKSSTIYHHLAQTFRHRVAGAHQW